MLERRRVLGTLLAAGAAAWLAAAGAAHAAGAQSASSAAPAASSTVARTIVIEGMQYQPATLTVRRGERITWVNRDLVAHTVTARDGSFDSGSIAAGASWSTLAKHAGRVDYACTFHPTMTAGLVVR